MARHLKTTPSRSSVVISTFDVFRAAAGRVADRISYWRFRNTTSFTCGQCDIAVPPAARTGAALRHARELATDHSRHGFSAGALTVYGS